MFIRQQCEGHSSPAFWEAGEEYFGGQFMTQDELSIWKGC